MRLRQRSTNVRRHVIDAFGAVLEQRVAIGHEAREESLQIAHDLGVGILLNQQTRGRVPDKDSQQSSSMSQPRTQPWMSRVISTNARPGVLTCKLVWA